MTPSHLLPACLHHDAGTEQAPELSQQRDEDMEDISPTADRKEEDEEAAHSYQHRLVNQPPVSALPRLLCKDMVLGWPLWGGPCPLPSPTTGGHHGFQGCYGVALHMAPGDPIQLQDVPCDPIQPHIPPECPI